MTLRDDVNNAYFEWIFNLVCGSRFGRGPSYRKLLMHLHNTEFIFTLSRDGNRADDGVNLRYRFSFDYDGVENADDYISGPCSVLEMMVALAIRCEENIMDDPGVGDRTGQWFWGMIANLGLSAMDDIRFDKALVNDILDKFLNREYEADGRGGLFRIKHCDQDLRKVEIWYQLCWFLDGIM